MLQDLQDLRRNQWKPRREKAGPKTIEQIHKEVQREQINQQLQDSRPLNVSRGGSQGGDRGQGGGNDRGKRSSRGPQQNQDEWSTVSGRGYKPPNERVDTNKINNLMSNRKVRYF